jgi:hypothetical protein
MSTKSVPTLYEWAGGMAALERLTNHFHARVREDEMLSPVFAQMHSETTDFLDVAFRRADLIRHLTSDRARDTQSAWRQAGRDLEQLPVR